MLRAIVQSKEFEISPLDGEFEVNGNLVKWDFATVSDGYFHILLNGKSYRAEVVRADMVAKTFEIKVNGKILSVVVKDKFALLLEQMGMTAAASNRLNSIKAPMPGLIVNLKIREGDEVKAGDPLVILEAMKMENIIKSPGDGTVKKVLVKKGASVEKNQVLIEF